MTTQDVDTASLGELDLYLIGEGRHEQLWQALGARVATRDGADGVVFTVWAPRALEVQVAGDFNGWTGGDSPMRRLGDSGVWEVFIPGATSGQHYCFMVRGHDGTWRAKADPLARYAETPPGTASIVWDSTYTWGDEQWMTERAERAAIQEPMSVYEVHLASWRRGRGFRDLADDLVGHVSHLGFTHVELMPVMQHPYGGSWGYHVTGYYAPDSRLGTPDDFRYLVDRLHQAGIGVILDWVPGHFATDDFGLAAFDGGPLYEDRDPRKAWQPDWGSWIFDFGNPYVRNFLVANALYWLEEFHADGLRVDGVASMLYLDYSRKDGEWSPNIYGGKEHLEAVSFLQEMNATAYRRSPGIVTVAEESTAWPGVTRPTEHGGLGFGFKWNMGWMHDSLAYMHTDPLWRGSHHHELTFSLVYAWSENYVLPISHDEVVHGKGSLLRKMPGDRWHQLANLRAYLAFQWAHPGKKLLFMGSEFAQDAEWAEARELDWWLLDKPEHLGVQDLVVRLNQVYRETPALFASDNDPAGFAWIVADDASANVIVWARHTPGEPSLVAVSNFSDVTHDRYLIHFPEAGTWDEVLNTDATEYGGRGSGNLGKIEAPAGSAEVVVPGLSTMWFRHRVPIPEDVPKKPSSPPAR